MSTTLPQIYRDSVQNFLTLAGSDVDPTANNRLGDACGIDIWKWRAQGGISTKILEFWPSKIATGFKINVASRKENKTAKNEAIKLKEWVEEELERLDVLSIFHTAEQQCQIDRAAPMIVYLDGVDNIDLPPTRYNQLMALQVVDPIHLEPIPLRGTWDGTRGIDHRFVSHYCRQANFIEAINIEYRQRVFHASRVLPLQGHKLLPSEESCDHYDKWWGRKMIGDSVVEAAVNLDLAIAAAAILIQKKNTTVIGIDGLLDAISKMSNGDQSAANDIAKIVQDLARGGNLLNVHAIDKEFMEIHQVERNLAGVAECLQKIKENLLSKCPNIPETYLFGMQEKGGLSRSNKEDEQVNSTAQEHYNRRWGTQLRKFKLLLLNSGTCPVKNFSPSLLHIDRVPCYSPDALDQAKLRLTTIQADKILLDSAVIAPEEARQREMGAGYQLELNLTDALPKPRKMEEETDR